MPPSLMQAGNKRDRGAWLQRGEIHSPLGLAGLPHVCIDIALLNLSIMLSRFCSTETPLQGSLSMSMLRVMCVGKDATCKLQKKLVLVSIQHPDQNTVIQPQHSTPA